MEEQNDFNMEISFSDDFDEDLVISILNDKEDLYQSVKRFIAIWFVESAGNIIYIPKHDRTMRSISKT